MKEAASKVINQLSLWRLPCQTTHGNIQENHTALWLELFLLCMKIDNNDHNTDNYNADNVTAPPHWVSRTWVSCQPIWGEYTISRQNTEIFNSQQCQPWQCKMDDWSLMFPGDFPASHIWLPKGIVSIRNYSLLMSWTYVHDSFVQFHTPRSMAYHGYWG